MPLAAKSTAAAATTSSLLLRRLRGRPAALALVARFPPSSSSSSSLPQPFGGGAVAVGKATTRTAGTHYRSCSTTTSASALLGSKLRDSPSTRLLSSSSASASTSSSSSVIEEPERQSAAAAQGSVDTSSTTTNINNMPDKMWTEARVPPTPSELLETNRQWHADADPEMFASLSKGQKPAIAWIGCSDSRVPAELVTGAAPGDLFVHRNIANTFNPKDPSALAFLAYAVNALGVSHVIVCGHKNCGGVQAALASAKERQANNVEVDEGTEAIQNWLTPLRALAVANLRTSSSFAAEVDPTKSLHALVEQNVCAQVSNVASCSVVKNAWRQGKSLTIHGWVYDLSTGKIEDLKVSEGTGITDTKN